MNRTPETELVTEEGGNEPGFVFVLLNFTSLLSPSTETEGHKADHRSGGFAQEPLWSMDELLHGQLGTGQESTGSGATARTLKLTFSYWCSQLQAS